jgi:hypothetical protein
VTRGAESVEVVGTGSQAGQFDVHAVRRLRHRRGRAALLDAGERIVGGDLPLHVDRACRHAAAAVVGQRARGQPGPDHRPVGSGFARGHAEGERICRDGAEPALSGEPGDGQRGEHDGALENGATGRTVRHAVVSALQPAVTQTDCVRELSAQCTTSSATARFALAYSER